jgi:nicotinic acid mononucleotide adenylyltransferase
MVPAALDRLATHILANPVFLHQGDRLANLEDVAGLNDLVLLPGNFNPLHDGHVGMTDIIESVTGKRVVFEIDIHQPHKPAIPPADVLQRAARINGRGVDLLVTENLPLYIDKARRYPGVGFAIGADAALRMLDPKWGPNVDEMIGEFFRLGTRFYVFDRGNLKASDIVSHEREHLFIPVPGQWDISSSELRAASNG